jgi:site-specific DNA recombinase
VKVAIYARVSTDRQREKQTIRSQLAELPKYAERQKWKVVERYVDDGLSGETVEARPDFQRLLDDAAAGKFEAVLVIDLDRLTRSRRSAEGALIYDHFREHGVKLATPSQGLIDLEDEDQDLLAGIKRELAKWEKRKIIARTTRGKLQAARDGKRFSSIDPYGLKWVRDPNLKPGGSYQIVEAEARIVRRIYTLALEGNGLAMIAWTLDQGGLRTRPGKGPGRDGKSPGAWRRSTIIKMLRSTTYRGEFRVFKKGGEPIIIAVPPIISPDTWEAVQAALTQRKTSSGGPSKHEHLLRGHASCGVCGYTMWIVLPRAGQARFAYFRCCTTNGWRGLGLKGPCGNKHHRVADVDAAVWAKLLEILRDPDLLGDACSLATKSKKDGVDWQAQLRGLERTLANLEQSASDVLRRQRRGSISSGVADRELDDIARERKLLEKNIKLAQSRASKASAERDRVHSIEEQAVALSRGLEYADFETRRKLVALLLPRAHGCGVVLQRDGKIEIKGILPLPADAAGVELRASVQLRKVL